MPVNNPKKLNVSPNERVDISDFEHAANDYTQELAGALAQTTQLDNRSRLYEGFRIEVTDAANGELVVYNGAALNVGGEVVADSGELVSASVTVAANSLSYIEVEFVEAATDVDNRAFWDPTIANTTPIPPGQEFIRNTSTRTTPGWQIVRPISTSGFEISQSPESTKIPLAIIQTSAGGAITNAGTLVSMSTVLEQDAAIGDTVVKVIDSQFLPPFGAVTQVEFSNIDTSVADDQKVVTNNDRSNGVLDLGSALTIAYPKGSVVRVDPAQKTAFFIAQRTSSQAIEIPFTDTGVVAAQPLLPAMNPGTQSVDQSPRMFQGDETRGTALGYSRETPGGRDDLEIQSLKDYVDVLAAQLRELKLGNADLALGNQGIHPGTDDPNGNAISTYSAADRYYRYAGGILGTRSVTLTVGDGVNSYGDFNGTDETPFNAALAALPAGGGIIFVKNGTYTVATASIGGDITNVMFVGESRTGVVITSAHASGTFYVTQTSASTSMLGFLNMTVNNTGLSEYAIRIENNLTGSNQNNLTLHNIQVAGQVFYASSYFTDLNISNSTFLATDTEALVIRGDLTATQLLYGGIIKDCTFGNQGTGYTLDLGVTGADTVITRLEFLNCRVTGDGTGIFYEGNIQQLIFNNCDIQSNEKLITIDIQGGNTDLISITNCVFESEPATPTTVVDQIEIIYPSTGEHGSLIMRDCLLTTEFGVNPTALQRFINVKTPRLDTLILENIACDPVDADKSANVVGISIDSDVALQSLIRNGLIKDIYCRYGTRALYVHLDSNSSTLDAAEFTTNFVVEGITHQGGITINPQWSIPIAQQSVYIRLESVLGNFTIKNSLIFNTGSDNGSAGACEGLEITASSPISAGLYVNVQDNIFSNINSLAGLSVVNILGAGPAFPTTYDNEALKVTGNIINYCTAAATALNLIEVSDMATAVLYNNTLGAVRSTAAGNFTTGNADALGITIDNCANLLEVSNNTISTAAATFAATTDTWGIKVTDCTCPKKILNNDIRINADWSVVPASGNAIWIVGASLFGDASVVRIDGNSISGAVRGVFVDASGGAVIEDVSIINNTLRGMGQALYGIALRGADTVQNIVISGNALTDLFNSEFRAGQAGISVVSITNGPIDNVAITGNTLRTTAALNATSQEIGINVNSAGTDGSNVTITGNALYGSTSTSDSIFRAGISVNKCDRTTITGNALDWIRADTSGGATLQAQIRLTNVITAAVSSNVTPGFGLSTEPYGLTLATVDSIMVASNAFGTNATKAGIAAGAGVTNVFTNTTDSSGDYNIGS